MVKFFLKLAVLMMCIAGGDAMAASTYKEVNVMDFGAKGDGIADDTQAIQTAIDQGGSVYFPPGTYRVTQLKFYWGDANWDPMFQYHGNRAKIVGSPGEKREYLVDISGQDATFSGLEFQGLGEFDDTYATLARIHTRGGACSIDKIFFINCVFRKNIKALTIGIPSDNVEHFAKISEFFFANCWLAHCQMIMDNQGGRFVDAIFNACHVNTVMPKKTRIDLDQNYIVKMNCGTARFTGCNFMQTDLNDFGEVGGWAVIFADKSAYSTSVRVDSSTLEWKRGVKWNDNSAGELHINGNTNGFNGFHTLTDPLFKVGKNCTGLINLNSFFYRRDVTGHGPSPLIVDASQSPEFRILIGDTAVFSNMGGEPESLMTRIIGGKYNFPDTKIAMLSGNETTPVPANVTAPVKFTHDANTADYPHHRFAGLYQDGWITAPPEGLEDAWLEVIMDWSPYNARCEVVRITSMPCIVSANAKTVKAAPLPGEFSSNKLGSFIYRGIAPGASVSGEGIVPGTVVAADGFSKNEITLDRPALRDGTVTLDFAMSLGPVTRGALQRIAVGTLLPGDRIGVVVKTGNSPVKFTNPGQLLSLTGRSGIFSGR